MTFDSRTKPPAPGTQQQLKTRPPSVGTSGDRSVPRDYMGMAQGKPGQWLPDFDDAFDLVDEA